MGVIYLPTEEKLYFAAQGWGAGKLENSTAQNFDPEKILSQAQKLILKEAPSSPLKIAASRSHLSAETKEYIERLTGGKAEMISAGSSLKFCLVAEGRADLYPRFAPTMEWDTAAGQAIIEQAGGLVLSRDTGKPMVYNKESLLNPWFIAGRRGLIKS